MATPDNINELYDRYKERIEKELGGKVEKKEDKLATKEYKQFKSEFMPTHLSLYEKLCNASEKF